jgi:hypothetical protein
LCRQALLEKGVALLRNGWWGTQKALTHPALDLSSVRLNEKAAFFRLQLHVF